MVGACRIDGDGVRRAAVLKFQFSPLVLAGSLLLTTGPAEARRVHVLETTDAVTKAYCKANPDHCETRINWGTTIGMFLVDLIGPVAWRYLLALTKKDEAYTQAARLKPYERRYPVKGSEA